MTSNRTPDFFAVSVLLRKLHAKGLRVEPKGDGLTLAGNAQNFSLKDNADLWEELQQRKPELLAWLKKPAWIAWRLSPWKASWEESGESVGWHILFRELAERPYWPVGCTGWQRTGEEIWHPLSILPRSWGVTEPPNPRQEPVRTLPYQHQDFTPEVE